jgi:hypothetical protein
MPTAQTTLFVAGLYPIAILSEHFLGLSFQRRLPAQLSTVSPSVHHVLSRYLTNSPRTLEGTPHKRYLGRVESPALAVPAQTGEYLLDAEYKGW